VYTLWKNPGIIPLLHCGTSVIERLQGGADLMIPGLIYGPPFPDKASKGAIVAVASHEKLSVPVVVGRCVVDVAGLKEVRGVKGVAVETFHWFGDEIWSWGRPGGEPPDDIEGWLDGRFQNVDGLADQAENLDLEDQEVEGGVALLAVKDIAGSQTGEGEEETSPGRDFTTPEIDKAFVDAFLYGINHYKSAYPKTKNFGLDFPLTQTVVMSTLVNPFLPAFTPHEANQLVIKKSSWKNIRKFIKHLDKQRIVKSKDRDGNEAVIFDVDFEDQAVLSFKPYRLPKKDPPPTNDITASSSAPDSGADPSVGQHIKVHVTYKPKDKLLPLFGSSDRTFYSAAEIKSAVANYVETENLIQSNNKRIVKLDPFLANSVFDDTSKGSKTTAVDKEALAKGTVPRDVLADRVLAACAPFYTLSRNDAPPNDSKPKSGAPPKILITLETRSGNKTATKISGLENYFIPPQPLADELRKACAGSTSVERLQGSSPKAPVMEVMVQGPQTQAVIKALEKRGVDTKRWVEVVDKTKGKGKR
jgi:translation initiation factor 2D